MIERGRGKQDDRPDETGSRTCRQGGKKRLSREGEGRERERDLSEENGLQTRSCHSVSLSYSNV